MKHSLDNQIEGTSEHLIKKEKVRSLNVELKNTEDSIYKSPDKLIKLDIHWETKYVESSGIIII